MYLVLGVGVGGFNFRDQHFNNKPWRNGERLSQKKFFDAKNDWIGTWSAGSSLEVDYVKVIAL